MSDYPSRRSASRGLRKELSSFNRLFRHTEVAWREIVFYAAQAQYISYFDGLVAELLRRGARLSYITSDPDDPILTEEKDGIAPFYLDSLFPFALPFLQAKVIVMTMPDLHQFHIRRSVYDANHVFVFHSLCSSHMGLRRGALDHFDTIFCVGPYHVEEIRRTEKLYGLKPKALVKAGYHRLEKIFANYRDRLRQGAHTRKKEPCVLIAPSWHSGNILDVCGVELVSTLVGAGLRVIVRPHPMTIARKKDQLRTLAQEFQDQERFHLDTHTVSERFIHEADVLISDWSGIALEYAFGTERPVLFLDVPRKVHNPEYRRIGIEPVEVKLRDQIGKVMSVAEVPRAGGIVADFLSRTGRYRERIVRAREEYIYNFGKSSEIGAEFIMAVRDGRTGPSAQGLEEGL